MGTWIVVEWMSDFKSLCSFPLHYIPSISTCFMTNIWRTLASLIRRGDIGHRGECTYLPVVMVLLLEHSGSRHRIDNTLPRQLPCPQISALPPNIKLVYFLYARPCTKLQGYENKQDHSYLERPYLEVEVPTCLIQWKGINWTSVVAFAPFQRKHYSFQFPLYLVISQLPSPLCILYLP